MSARARPGGSERGLTLVEMLVVLGIVGVAAGATVLGLGVATRGVSTAAEANRLAARLRLAADDAMLGDRALAFAWEGSRYAFAGAAPDDAALAPHDLPRGVRLVMPRASGTVPIGVDGSGLPIAARLEGGADAWTVRYDGLSVSAAPVPAR